MKSSELITLLQKIQSTHGDLQVEVSAWENNYGTPMLVISEILGVKFSQDKKISMIEIG